MLINFYAPIFSIIQKINWAFSSLILSLLIFRPLRCPGCKALVPGGSRTMYQHRAKECPFTMPTLCPICGQGFKMRMSLNNHIRIVHAVDKDKYACQVCEVSSLLILSLRTSLRRFLLELSLKIKRLL